MMKKPSVVFFGNERIATGIKGTELPTANLLLTSGYIIDAVFSPNKGSEQSKNRNQHFEIEDFAKENNIPFYNQYSQTELVEILQKLPASVGILVAYGKIVPQSIIDHFAHGIVNIHPSLLPKYRGSTPIEAAILDGSNTTGVSIMQLSSAMDAGPVYAQEKLQLSGTETKDDIAKALSLKGAELLMKNLDSIINGDLKPIPQKGKATICKKISKQDGNIDSDMSADKILRQIRAYAGWPKSHLSHQGMDLVVLEATMSNIKTKPGELIFADNKLILGCNESSIEIFSIQVSGKKPMDAKSFVNGYKNILS
ncbi:MAG: methionyl-tRNA formyltransferase [Patescibacteria group bacterium]|jgi:methionyl-tRNA formyltransferase|nr:methionyl-tRNA formyltransferase [Patescibacteria group bacterium]